MFHEKEIELYQSITAPESLKQRVVTMEKKKVHRPWYARHTALVTACASLLILLSTSLFYNYSSPRPTLLVEGQELGEVPVELSYHSPYSKATANDMNDIIFSTILEIDISGDTTITVSGGTIYDTENSQYVGESIRIAKDTSLCWTVEDTSDLSSYYLTVDTNRNTSTYILENDTKTGIWTISQQ